MKTLIELFDHTDPINNVLVPTAIQPDEIVFITDHSIAKELATMSEYFCLIDQQNIRMTQVVCDIYSIEETSRLLQNIIDEREASSCVIDATGGTEALLVAVGMICSVNVEDVVTYRHDTCEMQYIWGIHAGEKRSFSYRANIRARVALSGGVHTGNGHVDISRVEQSFADQIPAIFDIYRRHRAEWPHFVYVMQQLRKTTVSAAGGFWLQGPHTYTMPNGNTHSMRFDILMELATLGVINHLTVHMSDCSFCVPSSMALDRLCDVGSWLELYLYHIISQMSEFDDADMNVNLNWRRDSYQLSTKNELDVVATSGVNMFLISCKTALPQMTALNEIATLTRRFGGLYAVPVLATMCDLSTDAPAIARRAFDMDVEIIDAGDLQDAEHTKQCLREITNYWREQNQL